MSSTRHKLDLEFHTVKLGDIKFQIPKRYAELNFVGNGSQGVVCSAEDLFLGKRVAIKKLIRPFQNCADAKRTLREIRLMHSIDPHPNIIGLLNVFTPQLTLKDFSDIYLVMELMDMPLNKVIGFQSLEHEHISYFVYQLLCGLRHLHSANIIHRDLKPHNVVVDKFCNLKILDFGLARILEEDVNLTPYVVTRPYRSPELTLGLDYNANVDIWSLGCIFGEMILEKVVFVAEDSMNQWARITELLGTPSEEFLARLKPTVKFFVSSRPHEEGISFERIFPHSFFPKDSTEHETLNATQARHLLSRMLVIDPSKRITVEEALQHPYLSFARDLGQEKLMTQLAKPIVFDEQQCKSFSVKKWKELIYNEVKEYTSNNICK